VDGARIPPAEKLPKSISDLANRQAIEIRTTYWDHDMKLLLSRLESLAETPPVQESAGLYPIPPPEKPDPISDESLEIALKGTYRSGGRLLASYPKRPIPSVRNYFVNKVQDLPRCNPLHERGCTWLRHCDPSSSLGEHLEDPQGLPYDMGYRTSHL
jgi:hypothetical protein